MGLGRRMPVRIVCLPTPPPCAPPLVRQSFGSTPPPSAHSCTWRGAAASPHLEHRAGRFGNVAPLGGRRRPLVHPLPAVVVPGDGRLELLGMEADAPHGWVVACVGGKGAAMSEHGWMVPLGGRASWRNHPAPPFLQQSPGYMGSGSFLSAAASSENVKGHTASPSATSCIRCTTMSAITCAYQGSKTPFDATFLPLPRRLLSFAPPFPTVSQWVPTLWPASLGWM